MTEFQVLSRIGREGSGLVERIVRSIDKKINKLWDDIQREEDASVQRFLAELQSSGSNSDEEGEEEEEQYENPLQARSGDYAQE